MKSVDTKVIGTTFQKISDLVTPTMGPRGRLAVIADEFSRPYLTDDGVTVVRECLKFDDPFEKMVAMSVVEASGNTEKRAFDGTTLTALLVNEFYKAGIELIDNGDHPQIAADKIKDAVALVIKKLPEFKIKIQEDNIAKLIKDVSYITTKMPDIGELVYRAYTLAGKDMNVSIEIDRQSEESTVEHVDGMIVDSGYFTDEFKKLCQDGKTWTRENAKLFFLSEGILTANGLRALLGSINRNTPLVFVIDRNFNPENIATLVENLATNKLDFMFINLTDAKADEVFLDMAAKTGGKIQSATFGTTDYLYEYAGTADKIIIEQDKTTIIASGNKDEIAHRLDSYREELKKNEFTTGYNRADTINRRLANLGSGVTKIKIATASVTEYRTIRFKLDDAIGAVRCALKDGVLLGSGKTLYILSQEVPEISKALKQPMKTILSNAGQELPDETILLSQTMGRDAVTGLDVDLYKYGIIDSYTSIETAIKNASSIATSYLRAYTLINMNVMEERREEK